MQRLLFISAFVLAVTSCHKDENPSRAESAAASKHNASLQEAVGELARTSPLEQASKLADSQISSRNQPTNVLPAETIVVDGGALQMASADVLMHGNNFDEFLDKLHSQGVSDILARDISEAQRADLENFLGENGNLKRFACGLSICAGSFSLQNESLDEFLRRYSEHPNAGYGILTAEVTNRAGVLEQRIILSTDSSVNSIVVPSIRTKN
jgi:hypothetical protein